MSMRKLMIIVLILPVAAFAQEKELLNISWKYVPQKTDSVGKAHYVDAHLRLPIYNDSTNLFAAAFSYKSNYLESFPPLYGTSLNLAWAHRLSDKHTIILFTQGGIFSDMKDLSSEDLRGSIGFRYTTKHSENFRSGFGIAYSKQFFGKQIIPIIELNYKFSDKWQFYGLLPIRQRLEFTISNRSKTGFGINGDVSSYRLSAASDSSHYIKIAHWVGIIYYQYNFYGKWHANATVGTALLQRTEMFENVRSKNWTIYTHSINEKQVPVYRADQRGAQLLLSISYVMP